MRIVIIGGVSRSLTIFRGPLIQAIRDMGHEVVACAGESNEVTVQTLREWGVKFFPLRLARAGMSPYADLCAFRELFEIMRKTSPDIVLAYTIKPVIWGGLAARLAGVPIIYSLVTGLGYAFMETGDARQRLAAKMATSLYRRSLRYSRSVFFQNPDDMQEFISRGLVRQRQCVVVNGSGVDIEHYALVPLPTQPVFLLIGRLLADKGVREYVEAAYMLRAEGISHAAILVGATDPNPASVKEREIAEWAREGIVDYRGPLDDVRPVLAECSVYVLPSYREGTPRTVLEAMSMGRPIITTDAPGCRETIRLTAKGVEQQVKGELTMEGENGYMVRPRNAAAVAAAMRMFLDDPHLITRMGRRSREIAKEKYDVHKVNEVIMSEMGLSQRPILHGNE
ncbi:MAG: glycosyltransferase family 4 protein [Pirellulaceae bacterium]